MNKIINVNNVFIKYENLTKRDFLTSTVWVEYYQPYELELFKKNGISDDWIHKHIFAYEEDMHGSGRIFYAIPGEDFYKKREFVLIKSLVIINENKYYIGHQTIVNNKPKAVDIYINNKVKTLLYLTEHWRKENQNTLKTLSKWLGEEIISIRIVTEKQYKSVVKPNVIFTLDNVAFYTNEELI